MMKAVKWLLERSAAALFLDPGLGKTSITYAALTVLKREELLYGALVLAPLRPATSTWPEEQRTWKEFHGLSVVVLHGKHKDKLAMERHDVYVLNYEGLAWFIAKGHMARMLKSKWIDTLVFDELSKMKNASKKMIRRKLLSAWLPKFARRWGLTGSPASNGLINLFGQVNVLDLGAAFGPFITHFRNMYFTPINEWNWRIKEGAADLIYARVAPLALRMAAEDYVEMPEVRTNIIRVTLPPEARKAYDEMEDLMLTQLGDDLVLAGTASVVYGKCCQIASGALYKSNVDPITGEPLVKGLKREWYEIHDEKMDALTELIEELQGSQLLVGFHFGHDLERIKKRFGNDVPYIGSGVSVKKALAYEAAWNAGELPVLFGHPQSMGHGLNLQKGSAHHIAWLTGTADFELADQFERRLRRRGNKAGTVFIHHIVARNTVDEAILASKRRKHGTQTALFDALREYVKSRKK